ncbi:MAG: glucose-6-phosphate dehydrogenase [Gallionellaceae bacterium]|nr:glucose-6-phosphate dehydrogenase [Gallionellaceae bacterium]
MPSQPAQDDIPAPLFLALLGAAGDLAWRLVVPALYDLYRDGGLPERFALVGVDRKPDTAEAMRARCRDGIEQFSRLGLGDDATWQSFAARIDYLTADIEQAGTALAPRLAELTATWGEPPLAVYYLAIPPRLFGPAAHGLAAAGLEQDRARARLVVEKPLGRDRASFRALDSELAAHFQESQLYRMDHFLGKETVQNILALRFANPIFEPIWDRRYIDHVAITVAETLGVEHRANYYEGAGCLRDMVQNHLLQIFCLVAMEPPARFDADNLRDRKMDLLSALRPIPAAAVDEYAARGQYGPGWIHGSQMPGYRQEDGIAPASNVETFAAIKLLVDNWRWQDVPFYLRTGKRMAEDVSEVSIRFRPVPHQAWPAGAAADHGPVRLVLRLHPDEGMDLKLNLKVPGAHFALRQQDLRFTYREAFQAEPPKPYETLLAAVLAGDQSLFMRADQVDAAWALLDPVVQSWAERPADFPNYATGSWGPESAERLINGDGRGWLTPTLPPQRAG